MSTATPWTSAQQAPATLRLQDYVERRRHARHRARLRAEARRLDNTLLAKRSPRLALTVGDISEGGLSAVTRSPVEVGERLAVLFSPDQPARIGRTLGRVIRCEPVANGWRIAMRFDPMQAA
jgi:hypothetical protein